MAQNSDQQYHSPDQTSAQLRLSESSKERICKIAFIPVVHLISCFALAICMIYLLDGYNAVSSESPNKIWNGHFKLRVSDVTTLISVAVTIIKLLVSAWTGTIIWNCVFMLLEGTGVTLSQIQRITSFYIPPVTARYTGLLVVSILLLVIPQQLISPIITGAVGWSPGFEYNPSLANVQAGNPDSEPIAWDWYYFATRWRRAFVRRASSFASISWGDSLRPDRGHCRHVMNQGDVISVNSTLLDAIIPCIQIHSITLPQSPPSSQLFDMVKNDALSENDVISRVEEAPFQYLRDGNAVLFDPNDRPGLFEALPPRNGGHMDRPGDYLNSGLMTVVVLINGSSADDGSNCTSLRENIFGMKSFNNIFSPIPAIRGTYYTSVACFTYAIVNLTAGIATSATSTYISGRIVEADVPSVDMAIRAGPWVQEAIYLMPDVMSMLTMMNTTSLNTWENLEEYIDKVVRYAYQATWDMLYRSFDTNPSKLSVKTYELRLVASVSRSRVLVWLALSILLSLSSLLLVFGRRDIKRPVVLDGVVAALLTDPSVVLNGAEDRKDLTVLSYVTKQDSEVGPLVLQQRDQGGYALLPTKE